MIIEFIAIIAAALALIGYVIFGPSPINTFHFYFGLALLIMAIRDTKKEKK